MAASWIVYNAIIVWAGNADRKSIRRQLMMAGGFEDLWRVSADQKSNPPVKLELELNVRVTSDWQDSLVFSAFLIFVNKHPESPLGAR